MSRPTQARISLTALEHNLDLLRSRLADQTRLMAVVKADCYGHGVEACLPVFNRAGVGLFGVAAVNEARRLRELGAKQRIVLLTTPFETERTEFLELGLEPFISDRETADWLSSTACSLGGEIRAHLYLDTGMARNGAASTDILELARYTSTLPGLSIRGLGSHFATSDDPNPGFARLQLRKFDAAYRQLLQNDFDFEDVHIANSGGLLNFPESHYTLVRPGLSLYGFHPNPDLQASSGLRPVMTLRSAVSSIRHVPEGTPVSYGRRYYTAEDTYLCTLPVGYGDGLFRNLSGTMRVLIRGRRYPVVGTICMDEVILELGPQTDIEIGEEAVLIGCSGEDEISAWELALQSGTIPYEITTSIASRVPRVPLEEIAPESIIPNATTLQESTEGVRDRDRRAA